MEKDSNSDFTFDKFLSRISNEFEKGKKEKDILEEFTNFHCVKYYLCEIYISENSPIP